MILDLHDWIWPIGEPVGTWQCRKCKAVLHQHVRPAASLRFDKDGPDVRETSEYRLVGCRRYLEYCLWKIMES